MDARNFEMYLNREAGKFERESDAAKDKFNKGYFNGKAEVLYQVADCIARSEVEGADGFPEIETY